MKSLLLAFFLGFLCLLLLWLFLLLSGVRLGLWLPWLLSGHGGARLQSRRCTGLTLHARSLLRCKGVINDLPDLTSSHTRASNRHIGSRSAHISRLILRHCGSVSALIGLLDRLSCVVLLLFELAVGVAINSERHDLLH